MSFITLVGIQLYITGKIAIDSYAQLIYQISGLLFVFTILSIPVTIGTVIYELVYRLVSAKNYYSRIKVLVLLIIPIFTLIFPKLGALYFRDAHYPFLLATILLMWTLRNRHLR